MYNPRSQMKLFATAVPAGGFRVATLKLFADVIRRPQFSPKELDRVKNDTLTALILSSPPLGSTRPCAVAAQRGFGVAVATAGCARFSLPS